MQDQGEPVTVMAATGSGSNGASNDVAIVYPRGLAPFIITVFTTGSAASGDAKNAVIAEVARITGAVLAGSGKPLRSPLRSSSHR